MTPVVLPWRVWVSEDDLPRPLARRGCSARDGGAPPDRVRELREEFDRLLRTALYQAEGDPAPTGRGRTTVRAVPSHAVRRTLRPPARLSPTG